MASSPDPERTEGQTRYIEQTVENPDGIESENVEAIDEHVLATQIDATERAVEDRGHRSEKIRPERTGTLDGASGIDGFASETERIRSDVVRAGTDDKFSDEEIRFARAINSLLDGWPAVDALRSGAKLGAALPERPAEPVDEMRREMSVAEAELIERMLAERRQQGLDRIAAISRELHKVVAASTVRFGSTNLSLTDWATENPQQIVELFNTWRSGHADGSIKSETFERFLGVRIREFRGLEGERRLAFCVGQDSLMVQAPGGVNEPGIDLITFRNDRIQLRDNKAIGAQRALGKVSALEWNLPQNLAEATTLLRDFVAAGAGELPTVLSDSVLPKLEAANLAIANWVRQHPTANLKASDVQQTFTHILNTYGIDRVVDFEAAAANASMTERLRQRFAADRLG